MPGANEQNQNNQNAVDQNTQEQNNSGSNNDNQNVDQNTQNNSGSNERTFTQSEVNAMMAKEKREGKNSILKSLGFNSEEDAKSAFALLKALTDSQKTAEQKANENKDKAVNEKNDAEKRASVAESKLSCFIHGVDKDSIDDVLAIAMNKVTDEKDLDKVLDEMKKDKRYSSFFTESNGKNNGTGHNPGHSNNDSKEKGSYGKSLGTNSSVNNKKDRKSYFS